MPARNTVRDYEAARKERNARERGKAIPHYIRKVAQELTAPRKRGKVTPSKRG